MHLGMIRKRKKHLHFQRTIDFRLFIKCSCSTAPDNLHAMCTDRNPNSRDSTAARSVMHLGMIPKWRKHQHYMRRATCRHVIESACSTAPQNVHATCPNQVLSSGDHTAPRSVMHLGMIPKWRKHKNYIRSIS
jgi:hypothetical protein